jgi:hypothetical protein
MSALSRKRTCAAQPSCPLCANSGHSYLSGLRTGRQATEWVIVFFRLYFHALPEGKASEDKKNGNDCHADTLCCCHGRPVVVKSF